MHRGKSLCISRLIRSSAPQIDHQQIAAIVADGQLEAAGGPGEAGDGRAIGHLQHHRLLAANVAELEFARIEATGHEPFERVRRNHGHEPGALVAELQRRLAFGTLAEERPRREDRLISAGAAGVGLSPNDFPQWLDAGRAAPGFPAARTGSLGRRCGRLATFRSVGANENRPGVHPDLYPAEG